MQAWSRVDQDIHETVSMLLTFGAVMAFLSGMIFTLPAWSATALFLVSITCAAAGMYVRTGMIGGAATFAVLLAVMLATGAAS